MNENKSNDAKLQADLKSKDTERILEDEELDQVSGGLARGARPKAQSLVLKGQKPKLTHTLYSGGKMKATKLGDLDGRGAGDDSSDSKPEFPQGPILC